jgi:hypothetical protein
VPGELAVVLLWISLDDGPVRKLMNALFGTFSSQKNDHFVKTGSGQT